MNIKRALPGILVLLLLAASAAVQAQSGDGYNYTINSDNPDTISITEYTGPGGVITIPTEINNLQVTSIGTVGGGPGVFNGTGVTSVTIPSGVNIIQAGAFSFSVTTSLTNVTIPNTVTYIGDSAFQSCTDLSSINIPASVTNIAEAYGGNGEVNVFLNCTSLTAITVDGQNQYFSSVNGVLFNKSQTTLLYCPEGLVGSYTIPGGVTSIQLDAFYLSGVSSVTIPGSVTNIGQGAFLESGSLGSVYFTGNPPPGVGVNAFLLANRYNNGVVTVYYLPGNTGWTNASGLPTPVLWNPLIQSGDVNFGVRTNKFGFNITGTNNFTFVVEACTNLANPVWTPLQTITLANGSFYFSDPQWTNYPNRFYGLGLP